MNVVLGSVACALILVSLRALEPALGLGVQEPSRTFGLGLEAAGLLLGFASTRVVMGHGDPRRTVIVCALLRGAGRVVAGGLAGQAWHAVAPRAVVAAMGGGLFAIFLLLVDVLTLRRLPARRLYNFVLVMALTTPMWFLIAVHVPHAEFPRPHLLPALATEVLLGALTGLAAYLASPRVELRLPRFHRRVPVLDPERAQERMRELEVGAGVAGAPVVSGEGAVVGSGAPILETATSRREAGREEEDPADPDRERARMAAPADAGAPDVRDHDD